MKHFIRSLSLMTLLLILSAGCQEGNFKSIPVKEFEKVLQQDNVQLVDVRTPVEFSEAHIPGAININVMDISFQNLADSILRKNRPVALYCRSGKRSKKAAEILSKEGYIVYELADGFNSWQEEGKITEN